MALNTLLSAPHHLASNDLAEFAVQIVKSGRKKLKEGTLLSAPHHLASNDLAKLAVQIVKSGH